MCRFRAWPPRRVSAAQGAHIHTIGEPVMGQPSEPSRGLGHRGLHRWALAGFRQQALLAAGGETMTSGAVAVLAMGR